jgi:hypothetical protein
MGESLDLSDCFQGTGRNSRILVGISLDSSLGSFADVDQHLLRDVGYVAGGEHARVTRGSG